MTNRNEEIVVHIFPVEPGKQIIEKRITVPMIIENDVAHLTKEAHEMIDKTKIMGQIEVLNQAVRALTGFDPSTENVFTPGEGMLVVRLLNKLLQMKGMEDREASDIIEDAIRFVEGYCNL